MVTYRTSRVRRWLRWIAAYLAGVSVLAVIGLVIEAGLTSHDGKPQAIPPTSLPTAQWEPTAQTQTPAPGPVLRSPGRFR